MNTFTSNDTKQKFGELIELALQQPVSITRHSSPSVVVTSDSDYRELLAFKFARLKGEVARGFESFEAGQPAGPSAVEIAAKVRRRNSENDQRGSETASTDIPFRSSQAP